MRNKLAFFALIIPSLPLFLFGPVETGGTAKSRTWAWLENAKATISVLRREASGKAVFVGYAGWLVPDLMARQWVDGVISQSPFRKAFFRAYAVQGPKDPPYELKFIRNDILAEDRDLNEAKIVYIVAHSSGTFVADEFLNYASPRLLQKIRLVILDGGEISLDHRQTVKHKFISALKHLDRPRDAGGVLSPTLESWNYRLYKRYYGNDFISLDADKSACRTEQDIHNYVVNPQAGLEGITTYAGPKFNLEAAFPAEFAEELQKLIRSDDLLE